MVSRSVAGTVQSQGEYLTPFWILNERGVCEGFDKVFKMCKHHKCPDGQLIVAYSTHRLQVGLH